MFATRATIAQLTGRKRKKLQIAYLDEYEWPWEPDAKGWPMVLQSVIDARMGARIKAPDIMPNWGALRGA